MKHLLEALDRALEKGEIAPVRPFDIVAALERVAPDVVRKPVSLAGPGSRPLPVARPRPVEKADPLPVPAMVARDDRPLRGAELRAVLAALRNDEPDRAPWPVEWFANNDPADGVRCQRMWAECLRVSLLDVCEAFCKDWDRRAHWDSTPAAVRQGTRPDVRPTWIGSADFHEVCAMAGLDGEAVASRVRAKFTSREGAAAMGITLSAAVRADGGNTRRTFTGGGDD
jgi:hypothetical protein